MESRVSPTQDGPDRREAGHALGTQAPTDPPAEGLTPLAAWRRALMPYCLRLVTGPTIEERGPCGEPKDHAGPCKPRNRRAQVDRRSGGEDRRQA